MAWFSTEYVSQGGFSRLPYLREDIPEVVQPRGSLQGSETSGASGASSRHIPHMQEGDLITGTIDLTHELAHMLPVIRENSRTEDMVCARLSLDDNLTSPHPLPPGAIPHLLENHSTVLPARLELGPLFQYHFACVPRLVFAAAI